MDCSPAISQIPQKGGYCQLMSVADQYDPNAHASPLFQVHVTCFQVANALARNNR